MFKIKLNTPRIGLGCWAIGGTFLMPDGKTYGYSGVNDEESIRAINKAIDLGVKIFDTADVYGCGHSEELLGKTLANSRKEFTIVTKFGFKFNSSENRSTGTDASSEYIRNAIEASLRRLKTDYIDIYLLHIWEYPVDQAKEVMDTLDELVKQRKIRAYGWSTDSISRAIAYSNRKNFVAMESELNLFRDTQEIIKLCETRQLINLIRTPLAMGLLSGKYSQESQLPIADIRTSSPEWITYFKNGKPVPEFLKKIESIKEILTQDGRSIVQGALGWNLARTPNAILLPGFKSVRQIEENIKTLQYGPLKAEQMKAIDDILGNRIYNPE